MSRLALVLMVLVGCVDDEQVCAVDDIAPVYEMGCALAGPDGKHLTLDELHERCETACNIDDVRQCLGGASMICE